MDSLQNMDGASASGDGFSGGPFAASMLANELTKSRSGRSIRQARSYIPSMDSTQGTLSLLIRATFLLLFCCLN